MNIFGAAILNQRSGYGHVKRLTRVLKTIKGCLESSVPCAPKIRCTSISQVDIAALNSELKGFHGDLCVLDLGLTGEKLPIIRSSLCCPTIFLVDGLTGTERSENIIYPNASTPDAEINLRLTYNNILCGPKNIQWVDEQNLNLSVNKGDTQSPIGIYLGGGDQTNFWISKIVPKINYLTERINNIQVKLIVGKSNVELIRKSIVDLGDLKIEIIDHRPSIISDMQSIRYYFGSSGVATWERFSLGVLGDCFPAGPDQEKNCKILETLGLTRVIEVESDAALYENWRNFNDYSIVSELSTKVEHFIKFRSDSMKDFLMRILK